MESGFSFSFLSCHISSLPCTIIFGKEKEEVKYVALLVDMPGFLLEMKVLEKHTLTSTSASGLFTCVSPSGITFMKTWPGPSKLSCSLCGRYLRKARTLSAVLQPAVQAYPSEELGFDCEVVPYESAVCRLFFPCRDPSSLFLRQWGDCHALSKSGPQERSWLHQIIFWFSLVIFLV